MKIGMLNVMERSSANDMSLCKYYGYVCLYVCGRGMGGGREATWDTENDISPCKYYGCVWDRGRFGPMVGICLDLFINDFSD